VKNCVSHKYALLVARIIVSFHQVVVVIYWLLILKVADKFGLPGHQCDKTWAYLEALLVP
jgi:hypothetical protein